MKLRPAHLALLALAVGPFFLGTRIIARGVFDRSYDSTIWNYLGFGVPLLVVAVTLIVFAIRDARRG